MRLFGWSALAILAISLAAPGQGTCTADDAAKKPGAWLKQRPDDLHDADRSLARKDFPAILLKSQALVRLLMSANPTFAGIDASAQRSIRGESIIPAGPLRYGAGADYDSYICVGSESAAVAKRGSILHNGVTAAINVRVNGLGNIVDEAHSIVGSDGDRIYYFPSRKGAMGGYAILSISDRESYDEEAVIIAPGDRSPLRPVTREQYILARIHLAGATEDPALQNATANAAEDIAKIDNNPHLTPDLKKQLKEFVGQRLKDRLATAATMSGPANGSVADLKKVLDGMTNDERQVQASVRSFSEVPSKGALFLDESMGGHRLVTVDKTFFSESLPRSAAQFITLSWSWTASNKAQADMVRDFKKNFDLIALKEMLGK